MFEKLKKKKNADQQKLGGEVQAKAGEWTGTCWLVKDKKALSASW